MKLYGYFRSSAAFRVRIALNLKQIPHESAFVNLRTGEQLAPRWLLMNPQGLVPLLQTDDGLTLTQSMAILGWLDERYPEPPLLPQDPWQRALARSLANQVTCDIHPMNNLRVLKYLEQTLKVSPEARQEWYHHWIDTGFSALETQLHEGHFCVGNQITIADICLVPQVFNALRFNINMASYPRIHEVYEHCMKIPAFEAAAPENQEDAAT